MMFIKKNWLLNVDYQLYRIIKHELIEEIDKLIDNKESSKLQLIRCLFKIIERKGYNSKMKI